MKTLIFSSSLSPTSHSYELCKYVELELQKKSDIEVKLFDLRGLDIRFAYQPKTADMEKIEKMVEWADNFVIGMAVHCYSINDSLKAVIDNCFPGKANKFFGIVCSAGGEKSYLAATHLQNIMMNEFRMIPLPRIVYATRHDFDEDTKAKEHLHNRIKQFADDFYMIGKKLL